MKAIIFSLMLLFVLSACEKPDKSLSEQRKKLNEDMAIEKTELRDKIVDAQRNIDKDIDKLKAQILKSTTPTKVALQKDIEYLNKQKEGLDYQLEKLNKAAKEDWKKTKSEIEAYLQKLKK